MSDVGIGTMSFGGNVDAPSATRILDHAFHLGVNLVDTADVYPLDASAECLGASDAVVGEWLRTKRRLDVILVTKFGAPVGDGPNEGGLSRRHVIASCDAALRRLKTDFLDVFMCHRFDPQVPLEETLRALDDLVRAGKVRYVGCSNVLAWELSEALSASELTGINRFICVETRYNVLFRRPEEELFPLCEHRDVGVLVYNPLAGGLLVPSAETPKALPARFRQDARLGALYRRRYTEAEQTAAQALARSFDARGQSVARAAIAFILRRREVSSVLIGAKRLAHVDDALAAVATNLAEDTIRELEAVWGRLPRSLDPDTGLR